ncbi:MAG: transcriptional regulator [Eubacterium sp.]|nr:transcriptional regulator [Eubacterium sp.]
MLSIQLSKLLKELDLSGKELADYSGINPSIVSRIKTAERSPKPSSSTISKLLDGLILYVSTKHQEATIRNFLLENDINPSDDLKKDIISYLYQNSTEAVLSMENNKNKNINFKHFAEKLNAVMDLTNLSNIKLSKNLNVDPSYISRFRKGERIPKANSILLEKLCQYLYDRAVSHDQLDQLCEMIKLTDYQLMDEGTVYSSFKDWLCDFSRSSLAIMQLLKSISTFSPVTSTKLPSYNDVAKPSIIDEDTLYYVGESGIQDASERFLVTVIEKNVPEVWLYSDEPINWMTSSPVFYIKWVVLMSELVKKGVKIKIIHNIERDATEMVMAIQSWMPLYVSGCVEPYYSNIRLGKRFSHTIFIAPGTCAITSDAIQGYSAESIYTFHRDEKVLSHYEKQFDRMLKDCNPLAQIYSGTGNTYTNENKLESSELDNISIAVTSSSAIVKKLDDPQITIAFMHPIMRDAIRTFLRQL